MSEIVRLHRVPSSIVSDHDPKFTSHFGNALHNAPGTKLRLSSTYHPQTDGQTERTIQSLEDLLRVRIFYHKGSWDDPWPLIEFTYNNSFHATSGWHHTRLCTVGSLGLFCVGIRSERI